MVHRLFRFGLAVLLCLLVFVSSVIVGIVISEVLYPLREAGLAGNY